MTTIRSLVLFDPNAGPFIGLIIDGEFACGFDIPLARAVAAQLIGVIEAVEMLVAAGPPYPQGMRQ